MYIYREGGAREGGRGGARACAGCGAIVGDETGNGPSLSKHVHIYIDISYMDR